MSSAVPVAGSSRPALGLWMATALVLGNIIGSGLFLLPSALAPYGGAALLGWGVSLSCAMLLAMVFARLGLERPSRGGPPAYARMAFGDGAGFLVAWSYWISNACGNAAIAIAFAGYFDSLLPARMESPGFVPLISVAALALCTLANLRGMRSAGAVQLITTVLKFLPLLLIAVAGVVYFEPSAWHPFNRGTQNLAGVTTTTIALTMWAFFGIECATVAGADIRDPCRTIPRATLLGTALAGVGTILACMAVVGLVPERQLAASGAPFADAASGLWGPFAGMLFAVVASVSCIGALNGWVLVQGQVGRGAAEDGLFPQVFARCNGRGAPAAGLLISTALSSALVLANFQKHLVALFTFAILLSTATTLLPYLACSAAALRIHHDRRSSVRAATQTVVALLALGFSVWALIGTGAEALAWGAVLLLAGLPVYLWRRSRRRAPAKAGRAM